MGKCVLVVDDEPKNIKLVRDLVQIMGHTVIEAPNGRVAVEMARQHAPALILMDIQMPVMDGIQATRLLKRDPATRAIPIIVLTSYAMTGDRERIMQAGCDEYMTKPLDTRVLMSTINRILTVETLPEHD